MKPNLRFSVIRTFKRSSLKAFTLIEILLIVVLIGIFAGVVIPRVGVLFFDYEFYSTVSQVEKLIRYAQSSAVSDKNTYRLSIDRREKSFSLFKKTLADEESNFVNVPLKSGSKFILKCFIYFSRYPAYSACLDAKRLKKLSGQCQVFAGGSN